MTDPCRDLYGEVLVSLAISDDHGEEIVSEKKNVPRLVAHREMVMTTYRAWWASCYSKGHGKQTSDEDKCLTMERLPKEGRITFYFYFYFYLFFAHAPKTRSLQTWNTANACRPCR